jgi:ABC-type branched-subunit amino acid transport system ATPase component/predicted MFS family arabinose efflux permease
MSELHPSDGAPLRVAGLADAVLRAEAQRAADLTDAAPDTDASMPGVGGDTVTFRQGLAAGGAFTFAVLVALSALENLEAAALQVLAPDIRHTFGVSEGTIVFVASASSAFIVLGALPMGWLADRTKRTRLAAIAGLVFSAMVFVTGLTINAFTMFLARLGVGVGKSSTIPVHGSLIADAYPIAVRGRMSAATMGIGAAAGALSPVLVGAIASIAGGGSGWRWAFYLLGIPAFVVAISAFKMREPKRGQQEMQAVLGEVVDTPPTRLSVEAAFARLRQIRTLRAAWAAFAALGFGLFSGPVIASLFVEDRFHKKAFQRGLFQSIGSLGVLLVLPFVARRYDATFRTNPTRALKMIGILIMPVAVVVPIQYAMPNLWAFTAVGVIPQTLLLTAFTMVGPVLQAITPYRLRGMGTALGALYVFFVGATGGALLSKLIIDASGPRTAVLVILIPSTLIGGYLLVRSAGFIRDDLLAVSRELQEEQAEATRRRADPERTPALQVANIDFAYGAVQVLFDVGFEVRRGEALALLGTNGAGKSTILRAIAGLGTPSRGVVRMNGETITYVSPEQRVRLGIRLLPGGKGVFPTMTVRENLEVAAFVYRTDPADHERRIERVLDLFSELSAALNRPAGSLSGGQQQMLALAAVLLHEPEILLIDELSLGLAPLVVQRLLAVIEELKRQQTTIVIVEQSINVALAFADRAVFLEKGRVRFEGQAGELLERGDLARAVFLGSEGG